MGLDKERTPKHTKPLRPDAAERLAVEQSRLDEAKRAAEALRRVAKEPGPVAPEPPRMGKNQCA